MPLLIRPTDPLITTAHVPVSSAYAIINQVNYNRVTKIIGFSVGYYASEAACDAQAQQLQINALPTGFTQPASPEEADSVPIFQFLEAVLIAKLESLLPGARIERAP